MLLTFVHGTNQGTGGCPAHHEWVWFWLEGQASCHLVPAWTECRVNHAGSAPGAGVMPLRSNDWTTGCVNRIWQCHGCGKGWHKVAQDWMVDGDSMPLECVPCSDEDALWEFRGWVPSWDGHWVDRPIKKGAGNPHRYCGSIPFWKLWGSPILEVNWPFSSGSYTPFQKGRPPTISGFWSPQSVIPLSGRSSPGRNNTIA